jgi:hypothetical protein
MDFTGLKITLVCLAVAGLVFVYEAWKNKGKVGLTSDGLIDEAKIIVAKLEDYVETETKKVEANVEKRLGLEAAIETANADIQKAKDFADKVKALF